MASFELDVLFEDNHLLAVVKPAGLLVQGDRTGDVTLLQIAKSYLKTKYRKPGNVFLGLVHRLDRPVSGVVLLARTSKAARRLGEQFRTGSVMKIYRAVVQGCPEQDSGRLVAYLAATGDRTGKTRAERYPFAGAKRAHLSYEVREKKAGFSLLEVRPRTGRRHQIRAQLALAGHPIAGDLKYGAASGLPGRVVALLAAKLEVQHPVSGAAVTLTAGEPAGWPWPPPG